MNIGPTHDGRIVPIFEERLRQVGKLPLLFIHRFAYVCIITFELGNLGRP